MSQEDLTLTDNGDDDAALDRLNGALDLYEAQGDRTEAARTAALVGDLLLERGESAGAAAAYRRGSARSEIVVKSSRWRAAGG